MKNQIPKDDSARFFIGHVRPIDVQNHGSAGTFNFSFGTTWKNVIPKHSVGLNILLSYKGQDYDQLELTKNIRFISKGYDNLKRSGVQLSWQYLFSTKNSNYQFYPIKNGDTPIDSLPIITGVRQKRSYLRGGLEYLSYPRLMTINFSSVSDPENYFQKLGTVDFVQHQRNFFLYVGYSSVKEYNTSVALDGIKFHGYRKVKRRYIDLMLQPSRRMPEMSFIFQGPDQFAEVPPNVQPISIETQNYIRENFLKYYPIGLRMGYGYDHLFNSPVGFELETGVLPGVTSSGFFLNGYYTRATIKLDIKITRKLKE